MSMSRTRAAMSGDGPMGLKAPGLFVFMLSVILTVVLLTTKFFGAEIPLLTNNEFWALLVAQIILILGCVMRGL